MLRGVLRESYFVLGHFLFGNVRSLNLEWLDRNINRATELRAHLTLRSWFAAIVGQFRLRCIPNYRSGLRRWPWIGSSLRGRSALTQVTYSNRSSLRLRILSWIRILFIYKVHFKATLSSISHLLSQLIIILWCGCWIVIL